MIDLSKLRPGDCLMYGRTPFRKSPVAWLIGTIICIKTWSRFCHVEIYGGNGQSFAARDGVGVGLYPFRSSELLKVRRPDPERYNHRRFLAWFETVDGQKYDWVGLLGFGLNRWKLALERRLGMMPAALHFCSEFDTRGYRNGGVHPFNKEIDADAVAPAQFDQVPSPQLTTVRGWRAKDISPPKTSHTQPYLPGVPRSHRAFLSLETL
jgi:hypothetical protein